jgi:predicted dehydrogenase
MGKARRENQEIRIGIIGLGSIGWTHVKALLNLGVKEIYALRTNKGAKVTNNLKGIKQIYDIEMFKSLNLDGIIISNPTALHKESALNVISLGIPIFVEKPIVSNMSELKAFKPINTNLLKVGYCLRYHPVIEAVKKLISENKIGKIFHSRIEVGQYLPSWHPYTDYRTEYFSRKELGGGAIRTLSHELDLLVYFLGIPEKVSSLTKKISNLEIDVDDFSLIVAKHKDCFSRVELDFFSLETFRNGSFYGTEGEIHYDMIKQNIKVKYRSKTKDQFMTEFEESNMYIKQMKDFLNFINGEATRLCSYNEAVSVMKIIEESEKYNLINTK